MIIEKETTIRLSQKDAATLKNILEKANKTIGFGGVILTKEESEFCKEVLKEI
jgi:hypothetical protein